MYETAMWVTLCLYTQSLKVSQRKIWTIDDNLYVQNLIITRQYVINNSNNLLLFGAAVVKLCELWVKKGQNWGLMRQR